MSLLPKTIPVRKSGDGTPEPFTRIVPPRKAPKSENRNESRSGTEEDSEHGVLTTASEKNWDDIIVENCKTFGEALKAAGLIGGDSTLVVLGTQVHNVDVLLAEIPFNDGKPVDPKNSEKWPAPARLVFVEDKLIRNPESKRKVLAQILDYAEMSTEWTSRSLANLRETQAHSAWLERNGRQIDVMLSTSDILLVIAGDDIRPELLQLAKRFAASNDPTNLSELCLVSMALYRRGEEQLFIPHVVSAVQRFQRQVTVQIKITPDGDVASISPDQAADDTAQARANPETVGAAAKFLDDVKRRIVESVGDSRFDVTKDPQKVVTFTPKAAKSKWGYKVQFGRGGKDLWSPIMVGLDVESPNRDVWWRRAHEALERGRIPHGTEIEAPGRVRLHALAGHEWNDPENLDEAFRDQIVNEVRVFMEAFKEYEGTE